jgi:hypothetical protein
MNIDEFKQHQRNSGCDFEIVGPGDPGYDNDRVIANSRFNYFPWLIAYCENAEHVSCCINYCRSCDVPFRVRSGGHQHEGMCSANDVLLIDLSKMNAIEYIGEDKALAWIPTGKKLHDVYEELESHSRIIPGGSCDSVNVGGLTQGGGWGLYIRELGLTCDNIVEVEMVLADGQTVKASANEPYNDLFWAVRGGGGGNFGVATRFLFQLTTLKGKLTTFRMYWSKDYMLPIAQVWMRESCRFPESMSTFCRLKTVQNATDEAQAVLVVGIYFGPKENAREILQPFYEVTPPTDPEYTEHTYSETQTRDSVPLEPLHSRQRAKLAVLMQPAGPAAPKETCDGPHPHKVSSTFPLDDNTNVLAEKIVAFLMSQIPPDTASTYISLHGFGGAVKREPIGGRAFPYKEKEFMLQFQAWWSDPEDPHTEDYINWIESFRQSLEGHIEGAFINFPDKLLVPDPNDPVDRVRLLQYYYAYNLAQLRVIKSKYDPGNQFSFGMSIPLAPPRSMAPPAT